MILGSASISHAAVAGPPFLTDDPEPTETGRWEIYAPYAEGEGRGANLEGTGGVELNYGAARDLQITVGLPVAYAREDGDWRSGFGDLEVSAKYQFYHGTIEGLSIAVFPGLTLPTASNGMGERNVTALLPVWVQKDSGDWSVFGGGGYAINPGDGNRDYLTGGIAVARSYGDRLLIGFEADRQAADTDGGNGQTSLGLGVIYRLGGRYRLLASGGPTFDDAGGSVGFHAYVALGLDL
jgi:hypothetical protein